jgi:hypothetical protein
MAMGLVGSTRIEVRAGTLVAGGLRDLPNSASVTPFLVTLCQKALR